MKFVRSLCVAAGVSLAATAALAADAHLYGTEAEAAQACGADPVVWVDLDRGRFYQKGQAEYGKGENGGYGCQQAIHTKYRPARAQ